jgi:hypothetical protein
MDTTNPELELAGAFVQDTGCHLFLTGRAGTGKTTFLHTLKAESPKRIVVTAPTGVAAINAGGVTLHSFFQLPFGPFVPGSKASHSHYRFSRDKIDTIRSLDLLVIDEISMVRADLLDGVDSVLRRFRRNNLPFGGVQLLLIGDLYQLPPVVKEEEWRLLKGRYATPYFFSSTALERTEMVTIELRYVYRQVERRFIDLLNRIRDGQMDAAALQALNARHIRGFEPGGEDGVITLTTHNRKADRINRTRLEALPEKARTFDAQIEGEFPEHAYPTAAGLELKPGAQVMFVRNDLSPEKRYFNGKIGTVTRFTGSDIHVRCPDDAQTIAVEPVSWENIDYSLDRETMEITATKVGAFTQYPLRLAWGITIHKSQGLTFDRAVIDAQAAFAHGQVYVALSRCRTLAGMVLSTPLTATAIRTDVVVRRFSETGRQNPPTEHTLHAARHRYQRQLLNECFDFKRLRGLLRRTLSLIPGNLDSVQVRGGDDLGAVQRLAEAEVFSVGDRFLRQLNGLFSDAVLPGEDPAVLGRIAKASAYFQKKMTAVLADPVNRLEIETDNAALRKKVNNLLKRLREELAVRREGIACCEEGFSPPAYLRALSSGRIAATVKKKPPPAATYSESDIAHTEFLQTLKAWRSSKAQVEGRARYQVMHQKTLIQIAAHLPDTLPELKRVRGIGDRLLARYGEELVAMVRGYRREQGVDKVVLPAPAPEAAKPPEPASSPNVDTRQATLDLFEKGLAIGRIAEERGLARSTIEGHLAHWVTAGKVAIDALVPPAKCERILERLKRMKAEPLAAVKQSLGDDISYGDIRLVQAHLKCGASSSTEDGSPVV